MKKRLAKKPEEAAAIVTEAIDEVDHRSASSLDALIRERLKRNRNEEKR